jgi:DNA repair protein RecO (recombination protein O)
MRARSISWGSSEALMSRSSHHVRLAHGYVLHHRPFRDTGRILEVFTRDHGRLSLFARGVRGPKAKLAPVLQPFQAIYLSWSGRGEAPQLTGAEYAGAAVQPLPARLMACFYLNELLLKLIARHDPHPELFDAYQAALAELASGPALERPLRIFEKRLLDSIGYGLSLESDSETGRRIHADGHYQYRPAQGLVPAPTHAPGAFAGASIVSLAEERLSSAHELDDARRLLRSALAHCLEGRELTTRVVARSLVHREFLP